MEEKTRSQLETILMAFEEQNAKAEKTLYAIQEILDRIATSPNNGKALAREEQKIDNSQTYVQRLQRETRHAENNFNKLQEIYNHICSL